MELFSFLFAARGFFPGDLFLVFEEIFGFNLGGVSFSLHSRFVWIVRLQDFSSCSLVDSPLDMSSHIHSWPCIYSLIHREEKTYGSYMLHYILSCTHISPGQPGHRIFFDDMN